MKEEKEGMTTKEVFDECAKYSTEARKAICEDFYSDVKTLCDRMQDLFNCNPGVLMMYGVSVHVEVRMFNEPAYDVKLGSPEFYSHVSAMMKDLAKDFKEHKDDQTA